MDRDDRRRPKIVELDEVERSAGRDLAWIVVACVALVAAAVWIDAFGRFQEASSELAERNLNGLVALLVVAPVGSAVYAMRRYRDGMQARRTLARLTLHDGLTGLPNRRFLGNSFAAMLADERRDGLGNVAVLFIDLDRFKAVNDTYGHEVGDHLMRSVAERLRASVRDSDVVVRYAGDEFVVLVGGVPHHGVAERVASRMIQLLETPFELGQDRIQISASVGIAIDDGTAQPADLVRDADAAMYQAKAHGPGTYALFDRSMRDRLTPATAQRRMREAFEAGQFTVGYRPVVSLWTNRVAGVEAVLQWNEPDRGEVGQAELLPALEETGLIVPVGTWLLRSACRQSRIWADLFPGRAPLNVLVPVAPRQLSQSDFVDRLRDTIAETGAAPETIVLCLDEAAVAGDMGMLRQTARAMRTLGARIALVDPGAGLRSLGHVRHLDLDLVALDASAVAAARNDHRDAAVVAHVVALAKALGIVTFATGVEHAVQVEALRTFGCDLASGALVAPPLTAAAIEELLRRPGVQADAAPDTAVPATPAAAPAATAAGLLGTVAG